MTCVRDRLEEARGSIASSVVRTHVVESPNLADLNGVIDGGAPPVCHASPGLQFIHFADITAQNPRRAWTWMEHPIDNVSRDCGGPDGICIGPGKIFLVSARGPRGNEFALHKTGLENLLKSRGCRREREIERLIGFQNRQKSLLPSSKPASNPFRWNSSPASCTTEP